jgi:chemotaxis protein methyltransferase CheR
MLAAARPSRSRSLVEGEYPLTRADFDHIASALKAETGITLSDAKATLVYARLGKRLRRLGLSSFADYCALIESRDGAGERREMMSALTTNHTRFLREPHHFDHLRRQVLPGLIDGARAGKSIRIWSSACSSGEEPYSIALTLLDLLPDAASYDIKILATDIDPNILAVGRAGLYRRAALEPVARAVRDRWFAAVPGDGDAWRARDELRALITFNELNLIGPWPLRRAFDVIFCRNVVIYFDEPTQDQLWRRFADQLAPGGLFYIGHSERADHPALRPDGQTVYRRVRGAS